MTQDTDTAVPVAPPRKKPHLSFLLATWFGLGYLPKAPGTWGSLAGLVLTGLIEIALVRRWISTDFWIRDRYIAYPLFPAFCWFVVALVGVWTSSRVANFVGRKDPQFVVIDEVSGQMLTLLLSVSGLPVAVGSFGITFLAGFLLFRLFDIWKPFPIRHLEKLPGGWGIMADDWLAGIYAAILLRLALHFNLL